MQKRALSRLPVSVLLALVACLFAASLARADASGGSSGSRQAPEAKSKDEVDEMFERGMQLVEAGEYEEARKRFQQAHTKRKNDPDILNMLAYTQRKTGDLDGAFENYAKALEKRPKFPEAREYLGEAHIQAALLQIEALRGYGKDGEEELAKLVKALQDAATKLAPSDAKAAAGHDKW